MAMLNGSQKPGREFLEKLFSFGVTYGENDPTSIEALLGLVETGKAGMAGVEMGVPVEEPPRHFSGSKSHRRLVAVGAEWLARQGHDWSATDLDYPAGRADLLARKPKIAIECGYTKASKVLVALEHGWKVLVLPYPAETGISGQGFLFNPPAMPEKAEEELKGMVERLRQLGKEDRSQAKNTMNLYALHWRRFGEWCEERGLQALPATPQTVAMFLADRALRAGPVASRSARVAIYAVRWFHLQAGLPSPIDHPEVEETMAGLRRLDNYEKAPREEMTEEARRVALEGISKPAVRLMLLCRVSSETLAELRQEDLSQQEDGTWVLGLRSRGGLVRQVEIPEDVVEQLATQRRKPGVDNLITSYTGAAMTRFGIFKQVRRAFQEAGLPPASPRSIRQIEARVDELSTRDLYSARATLKTDYGSAYDARGG